MGSHGIRKRTALVLLGLLAGCERPRTELVIGIVTDLDVPQPLTQVRLDIFLHDVKVLNPAWNLQKDPIAVLPGSYGLYVEDGSEEDLLLDLRALDGGDNLLVERTARVKPIPQRTLFLRLGLLAICRSVKCDPGQTCIDGRCAPSAIDARRLPDYVAGMERSIACDSGSVLRETKGSTPLRGAIECEGGNQCIEAMCYQRAVTCANGVRGEQETDVDCGGNLCPRCESEKGCLLAADCRSATCGMSGRCK